MMPITKHCSTHGESTIKEWCIDANRLQESFNKLCCKNATISHIYVLNLDASYLRIKKPIPLSWDDVTVVIPTILKKQVQKVHDYIAYMETLSLNELKKHTKH